LLEACLSELRGQGIKNKNIITVWVPGSFEIPVTALKVAKRKTTAAVICLGAIIRGETYHYELVAKSTAYSISQVALLTGKPIVFEILATDTINLAYKRSQKKGLNKGRDAAKVALEMVETLSRL